MATPKGGYGKGILGTTGVIGRFKASGPLMFWAFEQGKAAERGEIDRLYDKRDEAAEHGTRVHELVEDYIRGREVFIADEPPEVQSGFKAYLEWESMSKLEIIEQEVPLVCHEYGFGGTPDGIGKVNGKLSLVDWKTSKGVYPDFLIQLSAYKHLVENGVRLDNGEPLGYTLDGGFHLCKFSKLNGDFSHHYYSELDLAWEQFKLYLQAFRNDKELKKRV